MPSEAGFWSVENRPTELSAQGDPLEQLREIVDFELFRPVLVTAVGPVDRSKGRRPPFDAVLKFKMPYLQAQHGLSFEQTEHLVRDRLSWMRLCGLTIADPVPDANTLWNFREALIATGAFERLFERLDQTIKAGKTAGEIGSDKPAKAAQKDTDAVWTVRSSKGKPKAGGTIPEFGYKTHISIDVVHGFS